MTARSGDLDLYYREHGGAIRRFLARQTGSCDVAEDLAQETFLRVQKADCWAEVTDPRAYLFACARNVLIDHFRRARVRCADQTKTLDEEALQALGPSEERRLEAREDLRRLAAAVSDLPPRTRKAFLLNRIYRLSYAEAGRLMGVSPRTVENQVARGLKICTSKLAAAGPEEEARENGSARVIDLAGRRRRRNG